MSGPSKHLNYLWVDSRAEALSEAERLIYRSNLVGADSRITNTGGGNTSAKLIEEDPLTGEMVEVLWVKGSGGDLRTSTLPNFASLYQSKVMALQSLYAGKDPRGVKTTAEDDMAGAYAHCAFNLNPRAASIDTPLHAFVPHKHVDHTHPNAVIAIAATRRSRQLTREVFGEEVGWTPWLRPGFELGLELQRRCQGEPQLQGVVLGQHGLINWADDDRECYDLTLRLIDRAATYIDAHDKGEATFGGQKYSGLADSERDDVLVAILPWLRGRVASGKRCIATVVTAPAMLRFINSHHAPRLAELGTSCPDHFLRTKIKPLYIAWDPAGKDVAALQGLLDAGLAQYRDDYAAYYERCKRPDSPAMRDPNPTVILIPGIGMIAWGKSKSESLVTAEFYGCAVEVMRGAEAIDEYVALPEQEAFDIEYWQLEEAKLQRMPPEAAMSRCVVLLAGIESELARAVEERLASAGACAVNRSDVKHAVLNFGGVDHVLAGRQSSILTDVDQVWRAQGWTSSLVSIGLDHVAPLDELLGRSNAVKVGENASIAEVAELAMFLLSDRSSGVRGQVVAVDGRT